MTPLLRMIWHRHWRWIAPVFILLALIIATGHWVEQREISLKTIALRQTAEMNTLALRGIIARHDYLPFAAAQYPAITALLREPGNTTLVDKVNHDLEALQKASGSAALFLINLHGTTLASSNWKGPGSFVGQTYHRRPYFEDALAGHRGFFFGLGLTTGIPGLFIADPVRDGGKIVGVLVVKIDLLSLEKSWSKSPDPVALQDSHGIVFLSSEADWMYRSENPLSENDLEWIKRHSQYGERQNYESLSWQIQPYENNGVFRLKTLINGKKHEFLALSTPIPELDWKLTVTRDFAEILQARREAQTIVALLGALLGMGVLYWRLRVKRRKEQERAITEREQREKELQLQRTARLASVGEMASTLAHELNQPLMALSNFAVATRAMVGNAPTDMLIPALDDIVQQSKRASEIVRRVRAFINPQRANYEQLSINDVISHAIGMLQAELQRNITTVQMDLASALPQVRGDKVLLEQVVVNLIQNAIHAQLDQPTAARQIDIQTILHDDSVQVSITDHGTGIPADKIDNLFTPFFTTKTEGLGLGLNICRTIVEAHGGHISVSNRPTGGAIFTITLPISP